MLENAYLTGLKTDEFWDMTFVEFEIWCKAFAKKQKQEVDLCIMNAYMTEALHRTKKLPDIEDLIKEDDDEEMTDDKLFNKIQNLQNKMKGGRTNGTNG